MRVIFERVDQRRYRIGVVRDGRFDVGADIPVRPAPGGADVPHDLVHYVVEEQAGLMLGIYGQVAAGSDVGGFFRAPRSERHPATDAKRSARIGRAGRRDAARSEMLAAAAHHGHIDAAHPDIDDRLRCAINRRLSEILARWDATSPGERLVLTWPEALTIRHGRLPASSP